MAQMQLQYFEEKITKLMRNIEHNPEDPLKYLKSVLNNWSRKDGRSRLELRKITEIETANFIKKLGNTNSHGIDGLEAKILKVASSELIKPIKFLINLSIHELRCPAKWKIAMVTPLYKGKKLDKLSPSSYRPITVAQS